MNPITPFVQQSRLTAEIGARAIALPGDKTDADAQRMAIETFITEFGQLDAVF